MTATINLTAVSPSSIGNHATCPLRLVLDSQCPRPEDSRYEPQRNFGKVMHWCSQQRLGAPPRDVPSFDAVQSAQRCQEAKAAGDFSRHTDVVTGLAADLVREQSPGVRSWVSEVSSYNLSLMPTRLGRKGELKGFGGSIDLLDVDRTHLWDFKFVGIDKMPEPPLNPTDDPKISNEYLWQIASYHILEKVRFCGIIWVSRCGKKSSFLKLDFAKPRNQELAQRVLRFIDFVQYKNFPDLAWPCRGPNCQWCHHKGVTCPAWDVPYATLGHLRTGVQKHTALAAALAARKPATPIL